MNGPTMFAPLAVAPDTVCLPAYDCLPGLGVLPVNSFVLHAAEPLLVDTGHAAVAGPYLEALGRTIDPATLRWIWLTHMDADHTGNLEAVLALAPNAKIVTNFLGVGKMLLRGFDVSRVHLLEPGASLDIGDRTLRPLAPPYYDAPETTGFFDPRTRTLFPADAFGALMREPAEEAGAIAAGDLYDGMAQWSAIDSPWLAMVDRGAFGRVLKNIAALDAATVLSSHLPAAHGLTATLLGHLDRAVAALQGAAPIAAAA